MLSRLRQDSFRRSMLLAAVVVLSFLIIFSRRPDAVTNPQFYAEDGAVWYPQAYLYGWRSVFIPELGYYGTLSRIVAVFSQFLPLRSAPVFFNACAIAVKIALVIYLTSARFALLIPHLSVRFLLAFLYLALPNSFEIDANLTNAQWHLALFGFLILIAAPSEKIAWKIFDFSVLLLAVLSGPFCFFLFPAAILHWFATREKRTLFLSGVIAFGCLAQAFSLLGNERLPNAVLGANFDSFTKIVGGQVFLGALVGAHGLERLNDHPSWHFALGFLACGGGIAFFVYAATRVPLELRLFVLYAALALTAAMVFPAASRTEPQWGVLAQPFACLRYWFLPSLCFFALLVYFAFNAERRSIKIAAVALLVVSTVGVWRDWRQPPFRDLEFEKYVQEFDAAPRGAEVKFPIYPQQEMTLIKK